MYPLPVAPIFEILVGLGARTFVNDDLWLGFFVNDGKKKDNFSKCKGVVFDFFKQR